MCSSTARAVLATLHVRDVHRYAQYVPPATMNHAANGGDVAEVAAVSHRHVVVRGDHVVRWIEVDPA